MSKGVILWIAPGWTAVGRAHKDRATVLGNRSSASRGPLICPARRTLGSPLRCNRLGHLGVSAGMHTTREDCGGETRARTPPVRGPHDTPESLVVTRDTPRAIALEDGTPLALCLASSGDVERLRRLFYRLSAATISRRLFLPAPHVPHWAEYFVTLAARDGDLRQAVVALKGGMRSSASPTSRVRRRRRARRRRPSSSRMPGSVAASDAG